MTPGPPMTRVYCMRVVRAALVGAAFMLSFESVAHADAQADFEKARTAYRAHAYEDAESRFTALLDPRAVEKLEPAVASQARMYLGAAYIAEKRKEDAERVFERLLVEDPRFDPDPLTFPTDVLNDFIDVRSRIRQRLNDAAAAAARLDAERRGREELEKKRQAERLRILEQMASEEQITVRHRRLVAFVPFGAGQFQNGQYALGWIFLGVESALAIGSGVTFIPYTDAINRRNEESRAGDPDHKSDLYASRARTAQIVDWSLVGGLVLVMGGGILQANLAFVPESAETKTRSIPQAKTTAPSVTPWFTFGPESGGGSSGHGNSGEQRGALGLRGTF